MARTPKSWKSYILHLFNRWFQYSTPGKWEQLHSPELFWSYPISYTYIWLYFSTTSNRSLSIYIYICVSLPFKSFLASYYMILCRCKQLRELCYYARYLWPKYIGDASETRSAVLLKNINGYLQIMSVNYDRLFYVTRSYPAVGILILIIYY